MTDLLTRDDWQLIERLVIATRSAMTSPLPGRRAGRHHGYGIEFHDYRQYEPGDDPRDIDWTVYARLDRLFLRVFRAEAELNAHLLVDASASMQLGVDDKFRFACKLAAAIAYIVASNQERVGLAMFGAGLTSVIPPRRGRAQAARIVEMLQAVRPGGASDFTHSLREYANLPDRRGLAIVITDGFSPSGCDESLAYLVWRGFEVVLVHVLAEEELSPDFGGVVEVVDVEDDRCSPVIVDNATVAVYRHRVEEFTRRLDAFCAARGILYLKAVSSTPFHEVVAQGLRAGLWERRA